MSGEGAETLPYCTYEKQLGEAWNLVVWRANMASQVIAAFVSSSRTRRRSGFKIVQCSVSASLHRERAYEVAVESKLLRIILPVGGGGVGGVVGARKSIS